MNNDMTYQEINNTKSNIKEFLNEIQKLACKSEFNFSQCDGDFFSFIAKHIVFFKYLYSGRRKTYFYKVLISDLYYFILSILENKMRYMYVNERSIIENYMRAIMQVSLQDNHVTETIFEEMHMKSFKCSFSDSEYSLIKSEYGVSCGYIHGGDILSDNLSYVLEECSKKRFEIDDRRKYYIRFQRVVKIFDRLVIAENAAYVSGCFHRKKSMMEYLLGKNQVDLLFQVLK
ncbi:hypothetical protein NE689_00380 [Lactonifactor longoviformis]|uniref:hypothetical protein n=1 Tax=Lactonifactor longoviformis TaxID=341220 RepID=UPI00210EF4CF|nr:hypothetical protein [Lactonifactor longoviformis]MCQ4669756.1 hypothetical protein [Lactonifactor longoviformis]